MKLSVIGNINLDKVTIVDRIPKEGENQAIALARFGGKVKIFACVGNDTDSKKMLSN